MLFHFICVPTTSLTLKHMVPRITIAISTATVFTLLSAFSTLILQVETKSPMAKHRLELYQ